MKVLIDADSCPVIDIVLRECKMSGVSCVLVCDTAHHLVVEGTEIIIVDKGSDCTDFKIANKLTPGDLVITQDYGLASMCLARGARVLHQDGWEYTCENIDALLFQRHESQLYRKAGGRTKGPRKRTRSQDLAFKQVLQTILHG